MLPILIYDPDEATRACILEGLNALNGISMPTIRISLSTNSLESMQRAITTEKGIVLAILGIPSGKAVLCTKLSNQIMQQNRDNYTLFCLHNPADLNNLLENCMRPAGIITTPFEKKVLQNNLKRILLDYQSIINAKVDDNCLIVESNGTAHRIEYNQILYFEALEKMLNIHTIRQFITVRRSLTKLAETLPKQFLRCHRSYVVNQHHISNINFSEMQLTMQNGDLLPISRSQRDTFRQLFNVQKGEQL